MGRLSQKTLGALEFRVFPDTFLVFPRLLAVSLGGNRNGSSLLLRGQTASDCLDNETPWSVSLRTCSGPNWPHSNQDILPTSLPPAGSGGGGKGVISELASPAVVYGKVC